MSDWLPVITEDMEAFHEQGAESTTRAEENGVAPGDGRD